MVSWRFIYNSVRVRSDVSIIMFRLSVLTKVYNSWFDNGVAAMLDDRTFCFVIQHGRHAIFWGISRDWLQTKNMVILLFCLLQFHLVSWNFFLLQVSSSCGIQLPLTSLCSVKSCWCYRKEPNCSFNAQGIIFGSSLATVCSCNLIIIMIWVNHLPTG